MSQYWYDKTRTPLACQSLEVASKIANFPWGGLPSPPDRLKASPHEE